MKTALSLAAVLALGCASPALAQMERYGSPYDQPNGSQDQNDQYGPQTDQYQNGQNPYGPNGQPNPGYGNVPNGQYDQNGQYNGQYNGNRMNGPAYLDRDDVRRLQLTLRHAGYDPGRADGNWGQQTASALADFQRANGIEPTGNLDKRTARALGLPPDQGYGGQPANSYDRFNNGQYGNELNNPDMDDSSGMNNNSPAPTPQIPNGSDQYTPH